MSNNGLPTALICGGGVAGLSAALHLKRAGYAVRIFDKDTVLRTEGVGLNIWPNGVRVMAGLGLADAFLADAATVNHWLSIDSDGETTSDIDVSGWRERYGAPMTGSRRSHLNELLAARIDPDEIVFEKEALGYRQSADSVTVEFADGTSATGDVLIAAEGIGSRIRTSVLGGAPVFTDDGFVRWRGVFRTADAGVPLDAQADVLGDEGHFGWIPISDGMAYWYGTVHEKTDFDDVYAVYSSWARTPLKRIIDASSPSTIIGRTIAHYAEHLPTWVDSRVVLIGDAAHPMYPGMAQGANQALVDGQCLAEHLGGASDVPRALAAFAAERMHEAHTMVEYSRCSFDFTTARREYRAGANRQIERYLEFEVLAEGLSL